MSDSPTKAAKPSHAIPKNLNEFSAFVQIVGSLRSPGGCPWDLEQTHQSLTPYALEEVCELIEALERGTDAQICEELGDVLLQVVLHARLAEEEKRFNIADVIRGISEKMVRRHPHVFGDTQVADANEVLANWQKIKADEAKGPKAAHARESFDVPLALPALQRAAKIGQKTRRLQFDWSKPEDVMAKVDEEVSELREALTSRDPAACRHEIGDLLFSVAQLARHLDIDPEQALREGNARFESRFFLMRAIAAEHEARDGRSYESRSPEELEKFWREAKARSAQTAGERGSQI